jgi:hypothetical protein
MPTGSGPRIPRTFVYRPVRVHCQLHEGERQALMELAEMEQRAPAEVIRNLIRRECATCGITIAPPTPPPEKVLIQKLTFRRQKGGQVGGGG